MSCLFSLLFICNQVSFLNVPFISDETCRSCHAGRLLVDSLFSIAQWKFLTKLSLDGIPIKHGKFLIEVIPLKL